MCVFSIHGFQLVNLIKLHRCWCLVSNWIEHRALVTAWMYMNNKGLSDAYRFLTKLYHIGSDNGLSPARRQAIILTSSCLLLINPFGNIFHFFMWENAFEALYVACFVSPKCDLATDGIVVLYGIQCYIGSRCIGIRLKCIHQLHLITGPPFKPFSCH